MPKLLCSDQQPNRCLLPAEVLIPLG